MSERRGVIDDVPVWWEEWSGDFAAGLVFRVGVADETPAIRGITHLVEHLVTSAARQAGLDAEGRVEQYHTVFAAAGERAAVTGFVARVCHALRELPLDRLEQARDELQELTAGSAVSAAEEILTYRFGLRGPGGLGLEEFGLRRLGGADVRDWANRCFTRANAVLITHGTPDDMTLPLAAGARHPRRDPPLSHQHDRTSLGLGGNGATVTFLGPRSADFRAAVRILDGRATQLLFGGHGVVEAGADCLELAAQAHALIAAGCGQHASAVVRAALIEMVEQMAGDGPSAAELERDRIERERVIHAVDPGERLRTVAEMELDGLEPRLAAQRLEDLRARSGRDIVAALAHACPTMIVSSDPVLDPPEGFWTPAAPTFRDPVGGRTWRRRGRPARERVVVTDDAVYLLGGSSRTRVALARAIVVQSGDSRLLLADDGTRIELRCDEFRGGDELRQAIDGSVPEDARIAPPRQPGT